MIDRDVALATVALAAFVAAAALVDAALSIAFLLLGAVGTVCFEAVALRHATTVREYWERPTVQWPSLALALAIALAGTVLAPSRIPSAGIGALGAYLAFRGVVALRAVALETR